MKASWFQKTKKTFLFIVILFILTACGNSHYSAEKLYWKTQRKVSQITNGKQGKLTDNDYKEIIAVYKKFSDKFPLDPLSARVQFITADILAAQGKYEDAQKELKNIINNFSSQADTAAKAYFAFGRVFEMRGKWKDAREEYEKIIDFYPLSQLGLSLPQYILGHYQNENDKTGVDKAYKSGVKNYNKLLKEYTDTQIVPLINYHLSALHFLAGNIDESLILWDKIIADYPNGREAVQSILAKAKFYQNKKDFSKAIDIYENFITSVVQKNKLTGSVQLQLGELYIKSGKMDKAKDKFESVLKDYPKDEQLKFNAYSGLAYCYRKKGDMEKLIDTYVKIKEKYPESRAAMAVPFLTAQYYKEKGDSKADEANKSAINGYERVIKDEHIASSRKREAENFLALCLVNDKKFDRAIELWRVLADKHKNPVYLLNIANVYRNLQALDKAIDVYNEVIHKYPDNSSIINFAEAQIKSLKKVDSRQ